MKRKSMNWSVKQVNSMINKGSITFDNPVQRDAGQWNDEKKSLFIHSLITMFVPELYALQNEGKYDIVDGKQRLTTITEFLAEKFKLSNNIDSVTLSETTGETFEIAGKKFYELPEEVQEAINSCMLSIKVIELDENDDEESLVDTIFYRLNNGSPMSKSHLALVKSSHRIQQFITKVTKEHTLYTTVAHFNNTQIRNSDRQMSVMQSIVLVSGLDFQTFAAKDIEQFLVDNEDKITDEALNKVIEGFSLLSEACDNQYTKFIQKTHISSFTQLAVKAIEEGKQDKYKAFIKSYVKNNKKDDAYRAKCGAGSVKKDKVIGRVAAINRMFDEFVVVEANQEPDKKE